MGPKSLLRSAICRPLLAIHQSSSIGTNTGQLQLKLPMQQDLFRTEFHIAPYPPTEYLYKSNSKLSKTATVYGK
eukprot:2352183-Amphidinium_carterae.1